MKATLHLLGCAALASTAACTMQDHGLRAGWALPAPQVSELPDAGDYVEGSPEPERWANRAVAQPPTIYVQLINTGGTTRHIEQVVLNRKPGKKGILPTGTVYWRGFDLAPGDIKLLPVPASRCQLPVWLHLRHRRVSTSGQGRATTARVAMRGVLPSSIPSDWLTEPTCLASQGVE